MMRAIAVVTLLAFAAPALAQSAPPPANVAPLPEVPLMPDEPLPEWKGPPPKSKNVLFLNMSPELQMAQRLRQVGIWFSSLGWCTLFAGGILYVKAASVNQDIGHFASGESGDNTQPLNMFNPQQEDLRNSYERAAWGAMAGGGGLAVAGFITFTIGQWKISAYHKKRPGEPLPSMSGF